MTVLKGFDFSKPDSIQSAESNEEEAHFLRYVKAGETITVGLLAPTEYAQVKVYDVYPLTGTVGIPEEDLFKKAKEEMFRLADILKEECGAEEARKNMTPDQYKAFKESEGAEWIAKLKEAYRFDTQERFLFGFYDFETGKPFVMQTTKKQAEGIYKKIAGAWTPKKAGQKAQAEKFAFTISKGTGGFALDVDTETDIEEKHLEWAKQEIPVEDFDNAHFKLSVDAQKEVIKTFASAHEGFDLAKVIGTASESKSQDESNSGDPFANTGQPIDISDDDLPF